MPDMFPTQPFLHPCTPDVLMFTSGLPGLTNVLTRHLTSFGLEDHELAWFSLPSRSWSSIFWGFSIVLLEDSITVEVIERGSAVHCISAYATWKHTTELQAMYAGYTDGTDPAWSWSCTSWLMAFWIPSFKGKNPLHMQLLQDSMHHHPVMLPQTNPFRIPHARGPGHGLFPAAFITFIKEGDIVIMGSDGVFDNLYLVARCFEILVVMLPHVALFQWWHLSAFHFFQLCTVALQNCVILYIIQ